MPPSDALDAGGCGPRLGPDRTDLAVEFRQCPIGTHSPDLQQLLNIMRAPGDEPFHVLIALAPARRWRLALMPPGGSATPQLLDQEFDSLEAAEWHVFKLRWAKLMGQPLDLD